VCMNQKQEVGSASELMGLSEKATRSSLPVLGSELPPDQPPLTGTPPSSLFSGKGNNPCRYITRRAGVLQHSFRF